MTKFLPFLGVLALASLPFTAAPAIAANGTWTAVQCNSSSQSCSRGVRVVLSPSALKSGPEYFLGLIAGEKHCSAVRFLLKNGPQFPPFETTAFLNAGERAGFMINKAAHPHVTVYAEGRTGGCNVGHLQAFQVYIVTAGGEPEPEFW